MQEKDQAHPRSLQPDTGRPGFGEEFPLWLETIYSCLCFLDIFASYALRRRLRFSFENLRLHGWPIGRRHILSDIIIGGTRSTESHSNMPLPPPKVAVKKKKRKCEKFAKNERDMGDGKENEKNKNISTTS